MDDYVKLLRICESLLAEKKPVALVNMEILNRTNGQAGDIKELRSLVNESSGREQAHRGLAGFARAVGEGASFSLWDEAAGALAALVPGGMGYREARDVSRGRYAPYKEDHPNLAFTGEMLGGAVLPGIGAGGSAVKVGGGLGARAVAGAIGGGIGGAVGGALTGAGAAREMEDVLPQAGMGAAVGGAAGLALGGALPVAGAVGKPVLQRIGAVVAPERTAQWIQRDILRQAFRAAGMSEDEIVRAVNELPTGSVVADLDPALSDAARTQVNRAPALRREGGSREYIGQRYGNRGEELATVAREQAGLRTGTELQADIAARVDLARRGGYDVLEKMWNDDAEKYIREVIDGDPDLAAFARDAVPGYSEGRRLGFREAQDILIDARDAASGAEARPGAGRRLRESAQNLEDALDEVAPGFRTVQGEYATAKGMEAAYPLGRQGWRKSLPEIETITKGMRPAELEAYRIGMLDFIEESLRSSEAGNPMANQMLRGRDLLLRLRSTFGTEEGYQSFVKALETQKRWQRTYNAVFGNSTTAQQTQGLMDLPMSARGLVKEMFDPGQVAERGSELAGQTLLGPAADFSRGAIPGLGPSPFERILMLGNNPMMQGAVAGQGAQRKFQ